MNFSLHTCPLRAYTVNATLFLVSLFEWAIAYTENVWDKEEADAVAGSKTENNSADKTNQLNSRQWGLLLTFYYLAKGKERTSLVFYELTKTPSGIPPVAILVHSTWYTCPWASWVSSSRKIPALVAFAWEASSVCCCLRFVSCSLPRRWLGTASQIILLLLPGYSTPGCFIKYIWRYIGKEKRTHWWW